MESWLACSGANWVYVPSNSCAKRTRSACRVPKNSELSKCRRIGETNSPISSLHAFRFISQKVSEVLKSANLTVISKEEFVTLRGNPDLIKAMTSGASFTPDDVESIYVLLPGAVQDGDIWRFPMYNVTKGIEVSVVSFKLGRAISAVNGKNWWSDSADAKGLVSAFKLTKFKPEKAGNNFVFANNMYQAVVIAEHFNTAITPLSEEDVEELIGKSYADMKPGEYAKKDRYLKWARRQAIKEILHPEYITPAGNPTTEALNRRFGTLLYEVLDRIA